MSHLEFKFWTWLANRLPKKLVYFTTLRAWKIAAGPAELNPNITIDQALKGLGLE